MTEALLALWNDDAIQRTYAKRAQFQLDDSTDYFFSMLDQVCLLPLLPLLDNQLFKA